jgi:hypothetical protein
MRAVGFLAISFVFLGFFSFLFAAPQKKGVKMLPIKPAFTVQILTEKRPAEKLHLFLSVEADGTLRDMLGKEVSETSLIESVPEGGTFVLGLALSSEAETPVSVLTSKISAIKAATKNVNTIVWIKLGAMKANPARKKQGR